MASENERVVRGAIEAWNAGDLERALETVHPDIVWINSGTIPDLNVEYRCHAAVRSFWTELKDAWQDLTLEFEHVVEVGESVVVLVRFDGLARGDLTVSNRFTHVYTLSDGKIIRFQSFVNWDDALQGAEASEARER